MLRLEGGLCQITQERGILTKYSRHVLCEGLRAKSALTKRHLDQLCLYAICRMLGIHRIGCNAPLKALVGSRDKVDKVLLGQVSRPAPTSTSAWSDLSSNRRCRAASAVRQDVGRTSKLTVGHSDEKGAAFPSRPKAY